jgi:CHRD domain-containing protein/PEP-CTERM motif-containing protein
MKRSDLTRRLLLMPLAIVFFCPGVLVTQASATMITFESIMSGSQETPPTGSPATGQAIVVLDTALQTLSVNVTFSGLIGGPATASHIHCCALPGIAAIVAVPFTGFPNTTSGTYTNTFDLTAAGTYNPTFLTNSGGTAALAESVLITGLETGLAYTNIHDAQFPAGEIRGQLAAVPEPTTLSLGCIGLLLVALVRHRLKFSLQTM